MDAYQNLMERRSCRKYKVDMVPDELIEKIIQAGLYAPSGKGTQTVTFVAITNQEVRNKLAKVNGEIAGSKPEVDQFYGAPVAIAVLAPKDHYAILQDGALALENLMLAAHSQGLGSCWINRAKETFEKEEWQEWLHQVGLEGTYEGVGFCILGYPEGDALPAAPRKPNRVFWCK